MTPSEEEHRRKQKRSQREKGLNPKESMKVSPYQISEIDPELHQHYQERLDNLTKPGASLGRLEELACRYAAIRHPDLSGLESKFLFTFAADHGVALAGVSLYPREVTAQMAQNFLSGGAAINVLCKKYGIENVIVDVGVDHDFDPIEGLVQKKARGGTRNFSEQEAMTVQESEQCVEIGFQLAVQYADRGAGLVGVGEMGIGNTTSASAIFSAATRWEPQRLTGRGTGVDQAGIKRKVRLISEALKLHQPDSQDPWDTLRKVGGYEIGAIMGMVLGCATRQVPVVVDGFISTAGAAIAMDLIDVSVKLIEPAKGSARRWFPAQN